MNFRYDGIYKVVKYYPQKGKSGFSVWRYVLRRDDPSPAPWTREGKKRISALGLEMFYPAGYLEATKKSESKKRSKRGTSTIETINPKDNSDDEENGDNGKSGKRQKKEGYTLEDNISELISKDEVNAKIWNDCCAVLSEGKTPFLQQVSERYDSHMIFLFHIIYHV